MSVWVAASSILQDVHLDRDSLHQRFTSISPTRGNLTHLSARKKKNASCNRYSNILPFDHNCIKVMAHAAEGSRGRYINASMMQVRARRAMHRASCALSWHYPCPATCSRC